MLATQLAFLANLHAVYGCLAEVLPALDVAKLASLTLHSAAPSPAHPPARRRAGLAAARAAITSNIWHDAPSRLLLLPACLGASHRRKIFVKNICAPKY